ncbi:hypothetical protein SHKM778_39680 [Streptomyces sp. KM77-8]|uniref:Uncharacterized protein n=1 Tax=Streptomyces haneummycinicus TaxID=3074435 RepID=A0AAT9HJZ7_9ACTN
MDRVGEEGADGCTEGVDGDEVALAGGEGVRGGEGVGVCADPGFQGSDVIQIVGDSAVAVVADGERELQGSGVSESRMRLKIRGLAGISVGACRARSCVGAGRGRDAARRLRGAAAPTRAAAAARLPAVDGSLRPRLTAACVRGERQVCLGVGGSLRPRLAAARVRVDDSLRPR